MRKAERLWVGPERAKGRLKRADGVVTWIRLTVRISVTLVKPACPVSGGDWCKRTFLHLLRKGLIITANRKAVQACYTKAVKTKKTVRCTIEINRDDQAARSPVVSPMD